ncbi:MAG TPA: hypothetical protein VEL31_24230 [Ktedonobacteraceae bacterium]|nr:hypothetical protein [Ktedonobacteraceae bacterium]
MTNLQGTISLPAEGLSPPAGMHSKERIYKNDTSNRTDLSELLRYPGIARCNANQSMTAGSDHAHKVSYSHQRRG